jgi:hypothetical protein
MKNAFTPNNPYNPMFSHQTQQHQSFDYGVRAGQIRLLEYQIQEIQKLLNIKAFTPTGVVVMRDYKAKLELFIKLLEGE